MSLTSGVELSHNVSSRNRATRVEVLDDLTAEVHAALRSFFRRTGLPHLYDEVVLPLIDEGDSQIFAAARDRPWPPWGLGARHVTAVCQTHRVADGCYGLTPVYVGDEDLANIGLIAAVYKEAVESLAARAAEVNYLAAENSIFTDHVLRKVGFERTKDVFITEHERYLTYRMEAEDLLVALGLNSLPTPDLLTYETPLEILEKLALFLNTINLASRAESATVPAAAPPEMVRLVRFGHFSKPGGVDHVFGKVLDEIIFVLDNFLAEETAREALASMSSREADFQSATVAGPGGEAPAVDEGVRRASTVTDLGDYDAAVRERLIALLPEITESLGYPAFDVAGVEIQGTASRDGDYFHMHADSDDADTRELTFVLFLQQEPRRFSGGDLRVHKTELSGDKHVPTGVSQTVVPKHNQLVVFPSRYNHEVLPVAVPSGDFADSRFTINGWIHRAT